MVQSLVSVVTLSSVKLTQEILEGETLRSLLSQGQFPSEVQPWLRSGVLEIPQRL